MAIHLFETLEEQRIKGYGVIPADRKNGIMARRGWERGEGKRIITPTYHAITPERVVEQRGPGLFALAYGIINSGTLPIYEHPPEELTMWMGLKAQPISDPRLRVALGLPVEGSEYLRATR
tara:strand:- start:21987 stop:22349 length:363 start_codon:yes stop_codon:yes gene_type:complete